LQCSRSSWDVFSVRTAANEAAQRLPGSLGEDAWLVTDQDDCVVLRAARGFVWKVTERVEPENGNRRPDLRE
jgi:hypothetical protein